MMTKAPKGTRDILPIEIGKWQYVEKLFFDICRRFGYDEIRIPVFEHTELFQRGVGDTTDIVQKEMYTFNDKGNRSLTLRPEGTAGVVRSYIENGMASLPSPVKLAYNVTCYRYENVQKGRYREFRQFGIEEFGAKGPEIDVEIISLLKVFFDEIGISSIALHINSIGCPKCRDAYNQAVKEFFRPSLSRMCQTCNDRFERNPLRIIDCKEERCAPYIKNAPVLLDYVCEECLEHFEGLKAGLDHLGIEYIVDKYIVRGLDYYTKTVFEFVSQNVGTQGTVCGGGRYDGLVEECGGAATPGCGFALGVDRLLMETDAQGIALVKPKQTDLFIVSFDEKTNLYTSKLAYELRRKGISAKKDLMGKSMRAQMKAANKLNARYLVVIGEDEIATGKCKLKDMVSGEQEEVEISALADILNHNQ